MLNDSLPIEVVAEQVMVRFSSPTTATSRESSLKAMGAAVLSEFPEWTLVGLPSGMRVGQGMQLLRASAGVVSVEPNNVMYVTKTPNDPLVSSQYALSQVDAFAGWEFEVGHSCRTTVAVVDSGIQGTQTDLTDKILVAESRAFDAGTGVASGLNALSPACNHATRVAGVAAASADNAYQIAGLSWGAKLMSLKVFNDADCAPAGSCPNTCATSNAAMISAINYAVTKQNSAAAGKVILNLSLGCTPGSDAVECPAACPAAVQTALNNAVAAGIPVIISAGNDGLAVNIPAMCAGTTGGSGIMPVGATDSNGAIQSFSSRGPELSANGVVAPGKTVLTTDINNLTASATGTSFSAPYVAGLAALILSAKPEFTPAQVQSTIRGGAVNYSVASLGMGNPYTPMSDSAGAGRINTARSLRLAIRGTLADFEGDSKAIAYPNPFRPAQNGSVTITIPVSLQGGPTTIKIYTVSGEMVREITGTTWDGKNREGTMVATGTYLFTVSTAIGITRGRLALIR